MIEPPVDPEELLLIHTCFILSPDGDTMAAFVIDGRCYTDPREVRRTRDNAWDEMSRRAACEWETRLASATEPPSLLPNWEQFRRDLDYRYPVSGGGGS